MPLRELYVDQVGNLENFEGLCHRMDFLQYGGLVVLNLVQCLNYCPSEFRW